ncbi:MAG TPA: alpha-L-arabinofuranosidase C-terminal domain-containing protein, partial [Sedimentisphaerales bacterium]|nr:alpha-L-arabinofuranosidase C-terminal domain-containing protein [Sedimentisphaerales bacterium]
HQDAELLESKAVCDAYRLGDDMVPSLSVSASRDAEGRINVTMTNSNPNKAADVSLELVGGGAGKVTARALAAKKMNAMNTFEKPDAVKPVAFGDFTKKKDALLMKLPAKSVTVVTIR